MEFTDQNFRELCDGVKDFYTDAAHVRVVGWHRDTPADHIGGAVIAEVHSRMEGFIGERLEIADRVRASRTPPESVSESHTRRRREEIVNFLRSNRGAGLSHPDAILDETIRAVVARVTESR